MSAIASYLGYVGGGLCEVMSQQAIVYRGGGATKSALLLLPGDIANAAWYFKHRTLDPVPTRYFAIFLVALALFVGKGLGTVGLTYTGSGLYVVIYSSATLWSALFSFLLYKQRLPVMQIVSLFIVFAGLCITAFKASGGSTKDSDDIMYGIIITLTSSCMQSLALVYFRQVTSGLHFYTSNYLLGCFGLFFDLIYIVCYTIPHWDELIGAPMMAKGNDGTGILILYVGSTLINIFKSWGWGTVMKEGGPVVLGLCQACKSIGIFGLSAVMFCAHQESQCYSTEKTIATVMVVFGVTLYSLSKPEKTEKAKKP